jgi:hypothetical protein
MLLGDPCGEEVCYCVRPLFRLSGNRTLVQRKIDDQKGLWQMNGPRAGVCHFFLTRQSVLVFVELGDCSRLSVHAELLVDVFDVGAHRAVTEPEVG